jgi:phosphate transport system permease protein
VGPVVTPKRDFTKKKLRLGERAIEVVLFCAAAASILVTVGIVFVLVDNSVHFFSSVPFSEFVSATEWTPLFENPSYGIAPLLVGTLMSTLVALSVAVPVGTVVALYLSEFATPTAREAIKPILELLAGVPTVIFGFFALLFVTPLLKQFIPGIGNYNLLSAGLVIGVLIIPYIASLSEDAMRAVPNALREGSYAMGATRLETALSVVVPAAISGIAGAFVLAMSRAVGETMIVAIAGGLQPQLTLDPRDPAATITAYIAGVAKGDIPHNSLEYYTIFAAGLTLMVVTLVFNIAAFWLHRRFREVY